MELICSNLLIKELKEDVKMYICTITTKTENIITIMIKQKKVNKFVAFFNRMWNPRIWSVKFRSVKLNSLGQYPSLDTIITFESCYRTSGCLSDFTMW